jgi:hypothetical protein
VELSNDTIECLDLYHDHALQQENDTIECVLV